jgi:hypothetical protein
MEFQSRVFVKVSNPGAQMADFGGILIMGAAVLAGVLKLLKESDSAERYGFLVFILGILCVIVGRIIAKGNMFKIGLSDTELGIDENGIRVGEKFYSYDQLIDLDFWIEGYDGMPRLRMGRLIISANRMLSGVDNKIHFRADGKKHFYQFYLPDKVSMSQLGQVFRTYYERRIPFHEGNRGGHTFLFRNIRSKRELEEMKRSEGYV